MKKILFVDDEPNVLESLKRLLRGYGCDVLCANSGEEALELLKSNPVKVIICDEAMPGLKGTDVLQQAKILAPQTCRIMLTGHCDNPEVVTQAVNKGEILRLVAKPWNDQDIQRVVADALGATPEMWTKQQEQIRHRLGKS